MPKRIRLGTVTNGSLDSTDATIEIDGDDLYITVENGDVRTDGTVAFEDAAADPASNGELQRNGADLKAYSGGAVRNLTSPTFESVTAGEADITNETFIRATRGSNTSSQTSGTFVNIFDGESKDVRDEFDASQQFSPDETGEYFISFFIDFRGSTAAGDDIQVRVRNVTDGLNETPQMRQGVGSATFTTGEFTHVFDLDSSKTYEFLATNLDNSFEIGASNTEGVISRQIVG